MPARKPSELTPINFGRLLAWLDRNPQRAGEKYEQIRQRLIKIFVCRGSSVAEDLVDETINRVTAKVDQIADGYVGDPALYFYGVAQNVFLEYARKRSMPLTVPPSSVVVEAEATREHECLENCINRLAAERRAVILQYYLYEKHRKNEQRKELAERLGIALNTLRLRVHRTRTELRPCVEECLNRK